jgi:hypothetical protein
MYTEAYYNLDIYISLFFIYLLGLAPLIGSAFPALRNANKLTQYLLLPSSTFEKFMVQVFTRFLILVPIAIIMFWIAAHFSKATITAFPSIRNNLIERTSLNYLSEIPDFSYHGIFDRLNNHSFSLLPLIFFSIGTFLFAGSVFFRRFALVKTLFALGIVFGAVLLSFVLFSHIFYSDVTIGIDFRWVEYFIFDDITNTQFAGYMLGALSWIFLMSLAYFKLKEKEV